MAIRPPAWQSWILAGSMGLLTAVGGYAFNAIDQRMTISESRIGSLEVNGLDRAERISVLEAEKTATEKQLKAIEDKLDRLINMHMK